MTAHPPPSPPESHAPPLVGREREQAMLRDALDAALAGRGALILIGGEAGIGKTTLAEAALAEAARRGALALVGRCYDLAETPPYGPWAEALGGLPAGEAREALPAPLGDGAAATSQSAIFAAARDALAGIAAARPLTILLDDLHWADLASLDLLRALARQLAGLPLLLLATYRAEEVADEHPLALLIPLLVREARAARIDLRPLGEADVLAWVTRRYRLTPGDAKRLAGYLRTRAEGNPLYTDELLRTLETEGLLGPGEAGDGVPLGDLTEVPVPALLRQVIGARAARLGAETRDLLVIAATIGQVVPLVLWAMVAEIEEGSLLDAAEQAITARLLLETADGAGVRFAHALIREALYEGTLASRRRRIHLRAGEALLAIPDTDPDTVAYHLRQAGDPRSVDWLIRAGDRAHRSYALLTAAARYETALALMERREADARVRGWLLIVLSLLHRYDDPVRALADLERAHRLAAEAADLTLAAFATFYGGMLRGFAGEFGPGVAEMSAGVAALDALPALTAPPPSLADALDIVNRHGGVINRAPTAEGARALLSSWLALAGRYAEATDLAGRLFREAPPPPHAAGHIPTATGLAHAALGRPEEARHALAEARRAYHAAGHHVMDGWIAAQELCWVALPYEADRPPLRRALAVATEEVWQRASAAQTRQVARLAHLPLHYLEGRWGEIPGACEADLPARGGPWSHVLPWLARFARERGDGALASRLVHERLPEGPATAPGQARFFDSLVIQRIGVDLALDAGDLSAAAAWLDAHDRWLAWAGAVLGLAEAALGWATYHRAAGDFVAAREQAEAAVAHASDPRQPLALLAAHRLVGELATDAGSHAEAATHLAEALALAEACAAPYERALTLLALAELRTATGEHEGASAALGEARAILEPLEARPALARADALAARLAAPAPNVAALPFGLSAREAEVLRLVARGLSDAQVAERLFLSPYTVKAHLRSIYNKTGAENRTAASRLATERGLA